MAPTLNHLKKALRLGTSLSRRSALAGALIFVPVIGQAAQPVIDTTSAAKLSEQLNATREQTKVLNGISSASEATHTEVQDRAPASPKTKEGAK